MREKPFPLEAVTVVVVQSLRHVRLMATLWTAAHQVPLSFSVSQNLLIFMSIESVMLSNFPFSTTLLSSCPQSFPESESFPMTWFFTSGGQSIGASALVSVLSMNIQGRFPLELTDLISLLSKELSESSPAPQFESINSSVF